MDTRKVKNWNELIQFIDKTNLDKETIILSGFLVDIHTKKIKKLIVSRITNVACKLIDNGSL